jgi:uncharacterized membrane protein
MLDIKIQYKEKNHKEEVKKIIDEVINEVRNNKPIGSTETARLIDTIYSTKEIEGFEIPYGFTTLKAGRDYDNNTIRIYINSCGVEYNKQELRQLVDMLYKMCEQM